MSTESMLIPTRQLAGNNKAHFPNESSAYRSARNALLIEEIELRRQMERVASQRRTLPPGGEIPQDFEFFSETGSIGFQPVRRQGHADGLQHDVRPTAQVAMSHVYVLFSAWNGMAVNLRERVAIAVTARSPIERLSEFKKLRGFINVHFYSDTSGEYTRTYVSSEDADIPGFSVFAKRDGTIYHFYSGEMSGEMADPGQDPRGAPDLDPLWLMLDWTPEGRGVDWYPKLDYGHK